MAKVNQFATNQFAMDFSKFKPHKKYDYKDRSHIPDWFYPNLESQILLRHILYRRHLNMNTILLIVGAVRTGKSYMALKIAETYCKILNLDWDVKKQCSFEIIPFLKWSQRERDNIFVIDEVGVSLNPQEWWTIQNKVFRNFTQAQGFRRNVMVLVLPNVSFLNKSIRFMVNYIIETRGQGKGYVQKLVMNHTRGKGFPMGIGYIKFSLPSKETIEYYESMKKKWNDDRLAEDILELEQFEQKRRERYEDFNRPVEPVLRLNRNRYDQVPV